MCSGLGGGVCGPEWRTGLSECKIFKIKTPFMDLLMSMPPWHIIFSQVMIFLQPLVINSALPVSAPEGPWNKFAPYDRKKMVAQTFHIYLRIDLRFLPSFIQIAWETNGNSSIPLLNRLDFCFLKVVYNKYNSVFYCREHFYFVWMCLCVLCLLLYTQQFKQNYEIKLKYRQNIILFTFLVNFTDIIIVFVCVCVCASRSD